MSLARTLRQRFRTDSKAEGPEHTGEDTRACASGDEFEVVTPTAEKEETMEKMTWNSAMEGPTLEEGFKDGDEKAVYETQLTQLHEQLVATMIENQSLQQQIKQLEDRLDRDKTLALLEYERHRANLLEEKCTRLEKQKRPRRPQRSRSDVTVRPQLDLDRSLLAGDGTDVEVASEAEEDSLSDAGSEEVRKPSGRQSWRYQMWERVLSMVYSIMDDFTDLPAEEPQGDPEGDPLTVKKLKENIKRAGAAAKPYINTIKGIHGLLTWKSPPYTLIVFMVYMYSVWYGWFLPLFLSCLTFRLAISYLRHRGWNINFNFFDCHEEEKREAEDKDLGVSDKFNLVLQVARKVQNTLGTAADSLEKIKSFLMWRHPVSTKPVFFTLLVTMLASCFLQASYLFFVAGLYIGVKLFLLDYLFMRFPRFRMKYDSSFKMWQQLPTDAEYEKRSMKSEIDRYILPKSRPEEAQDTPDCADAETLSVDDKQFCELFSFPLSESPLPGWHGGRRCTLINREKSLTAAFKNGRLYLTHSFLCFERTKAPSPKNIVVPLTDITRLEKAKPYAWMPGGGMAIEVAVAGSDKLLFGGLVKRDEVYESLMIYGIVLGLPFAATDSRPSSTATRERRRSLSAHTSVPSDSL
ncbi:GRAM domain-containing protein 4-like isoform X2 [Babylonia areolata]|uniref:GRAM domain-containing protein 4-like isoform X2 n=1 Tax=Babylonia areolata TaxID=304850 RepID=UPI003FD0D536